MIGVKEIRDSFLHILFPHVCSGCGSDIINPENVVCLRCMSEMPATRFHMYVNNPVEKIFWGRLPLVQASSQFYFSKDSLMQQLMHELKYKGNKELGLQLGRLMGQHLQQTNRFSNIDAFIPLPLFPAKEKRRGYNQSSLLCQGITEVMKLEILDDVVIRTHHTETQTKKGRMERWENIEGRFQVIHPEKIANKSILLVDDVITTGATIEACGQAVLQAHGTRLSVLSLCYASK